MYASRQFEARMVGYARGGERRARKHARAGVAGAGARVSALADWDYLQKFASSEKSVGHRYAPMGTGSSARAAREPDVG